MASKITVAEEVNSFGQQVFVFSLPNGRRLGLDFCPHLIDPDGDACCAVATLENHDGETVPLAVNGSGGSEKQLMQVANLWFSTPEEDNRHGQILTQELDTMKEELAPIMEAIEKQERHKNN